MLKQSIAMFTITIIMLYMQHVHTPNTHCTEYKVSALFERASSHCDHPNANQCGGGGCVPVRIVVSSPPTPPTPRASCSRVQKKTNCLHSDVPHAQISTVLVVQYTTADIIDTSAHTCLAYRNRARSHCTTTYVVDDGARRPTG